uniref:Uncharacterized protein n=1 Tax=Arundo donax TaxID=35708 RepID=A0A0A9H8S0_ARUDO
MHAISCNHGGPCNHIPFLEHVEPLASLVHKPTPGIHAHKGSTKKHTHVHLFRNHASLHFTSQVQSTSLCTSRERGH